MDIQTENPLTHPYSSRRYLLGCPPSQYSYIVQEAQVTSRGLPHDVQDYIQVVSLGFLNHQPYLAGGCKHFAVSPPGEDYQFDGCIFFRWVETEGSDRSVNRPAGFQEDPVRFIYKFSINLLLPWDFWEPFPLLY